MKNNNPIQPNEISEATKASLKTRILSAVIGLAIIIPAIFIGDFFFFTLVAAVVFFANFEIVKCAKQKYCVWLYIVTIFLAFLIVYWPFFRGFIFETQEGEGPFRLYKLIKEPYIPITIIFVGVVLIFFIVVLHPSLTVKDACFIFTLVVVTCLGIQSVLYLRYLPSQINASNGLANENYFNLFDNFESSTLLIYALLGAIAADCGAYFVGIFFGKHKLNERISPKKTIEGFVGGIIISSIVTAAFAFILAACGHPILGMFDMNHWYNIVAVSCTMPFLATLGDLIFSSIKRYFAIKDFGNLIPGHGGVLDRLDSIIFVVIFVAIYVCIVLNVSNLSKEAFI